jgi:hypothetical protein
MNRVIATILLLGIVIRALEPSQQYVLVSSNRPTTGHVPATFCYDNAAAMSHESLLYQSVVMEGDVIYPMIANHDTTRLTDLLPLGYALYTLNGNHLEYMTDSTNLTRPDGNSKWTNLDIHRMDGDELGNETHFWTGFDHNGQVHTRTCNEFTNTEGEGQYGRLTTGLGHVAASCHSWLNVICIIKYTVAASVNP